MIDFDFNDDLGAEPFKGAAEIQKKAHVANGGESTMLRVCPKCNGRGSRTYGYVNIKTYPCGWCKQTGKVSDEREANIARAIKANETRENNARIRAQEFQDAHAAECEFVARNSEWSDFYRSLHQSRIDYGSWTENQLASIRRGMEKAAAKRAEKEASRPVVDVSAIERLFDTATANGLKRPKFVTDVLQISKAPAHGRNAGALYVQYKGEYAGKIVSGKYQATSAAPADTIEKINEIAADPLGVAQMYGKQTGRCCCCSRELTDPVSIERGIGPICEAKWF